MPSQSATNHLPHSYMQVDANCDGSVDWDEYLSYMLLIEGGLFSPER